MAVLSKKWLVAFLSEVDFSMPYWKIVEKFHMNYARIARYLKDCRKIFTKLSQIMIDDNF